MNSHGCFWHWVHLELVLVPGERGQYSDCHFQWKYIKDFQLYHWPDSTKLKHSAKSESCQCLQYLASIPTLNCSQSEQCLEEFSFISFRFTDNRKKFESWKDLMTGIPHSINDFNTSMHWRIHSNSPVKMNITWVEGMSGRFSDWCEMWVDFVLTGVKLLSNIHS